MSSFRNYCMCGGYAWSMNGRDPENPHMDWCPQKEEYIHWMETGKTYDDEESDI